MRKGFWSRFDDLMSSLPGEIDRHIKDVDSSVNTWGSNNVVISSGSSVKQSSKSGSSSTTISQGGDKIVITTKNKKTTIKVNGKEYVPKIEAKK